MFAFASLQLLSFMNTGVVVPGQAWCGERKETNSPFSSKGLSTQAGTACGGAGATRSVRVCPTVVGL